MAVNQVAIERLRLDEAFTAKMLHRAFNDCWTVRCDKELLVVDDEETKASRFGKDGDDVAKALLIVNENRREIVLLSIDNQLLKNIPGGIADCALFDDKQFRFVEFKTNAEGRTAKAATNTFDKATRQLKNTIRIFTDGLQRVNVRFEDAVTIGCHIVLPHTFPASHSLTQNYQLEFAEETGGIKLSFDSETQWEKPAEAI